MRTFSDEQFKAQIETDTGMRPDWNPEAFTDAAADIRQSINRLRATSFLPHADAARGFVYNEKTGALDESQQNKSEAGHESPHASGWPAPAPPQQASLSPGWWPMLPPTSHEHRPLTSSPSEESANCTTARPSPDLP